VEVVQEDHQLEQMVPMVQVQYLTHLHLLVAEEELMAAERLRPLAMPVVLVVAKEVKQEQELEALELQVKETMVVGLLRQTLVVLMEAVVVEVLVAQEEMRLMPAALAAMVVMEQTQQFQE
jgi:hypothetical protein